MAKRRRKKKPVKLKIRTETLQSIVAILLMALGLLIIVSFSGQGELLASINLVLSEKFGASLLLLPFVFLSAGLVLFQTKWAWSKPNVLLGTMMLMIGAMGLFKTGQIGNQFFENMSQLIAKPGAFIFFGAILISGALVMTQFSIAEVLELGMNVGKKKDKKLKDKDAKGEQLGVDDKPKKGFGFSLPKLSLPLKKSSGMSVNDHKKSPSDEQAAGLAVAQAKALPKLKKTDDLPNLLVPANTQSVWEYPPLSLLSDSDGGEADRGDVKKNADTIEATLESFGIKANVKEANFGPSVTQYALEIGRGTKLSKITGLSTDLALALAAPTGQVRIEAPIAGRSLIGVEVPNYSAQFVTLRHMLKSEELKKHPSKLAVALGINVSNKPIVVNISDMPHMLIAGATGSGKSVAINSFICSMLFRASPEEVRLILVDPKRVELTGYNDIPHLLTPVIVDPKKVVSALKWAVNEMENRYKKLAEVGVRNIAGYNELAGLVAMPHIVIVIDELADIMLFAPSEVEESITRIAQMARAVGIHLILATQRPSVDVLTGLIKANIPARIAFNVSSMTDSRVILDTPGAEKLLGRGDMLFTPPDQAKPSRIQGTFVSDKEIKSLIKFIKDQGQRPEYQEEITTKYKVVGKGSGGKVTADGGEDKDELFTEVAKFVVTQDKASSSMVQRRFSVGYNRAARILDQLYEAGLIGPAEGSKARSVQATRIMEYVHSVEGGAEAS
jgi:DNA segregation ATPase FtsK/SpoIIIE, S-DNA-T family